jgi:hypothetical protein
MRVSSVCDLVLRRLYEHILDFFGFLKMLKEHLLVVMHVSFAHGVQDSLASPPEGRLPDAKKGML